MLAKGGQRWVLVKDPYDPLTNFSRGHKLLLVTPERANDLAKGRSLTQTPKGPFAFIGIADGGTIEISEVVEFGMETPHPVVLGWLTTRDGLVYPFESEWTKAHFEQVPLI